MIGKPGHRPGFALLGGAGAIACAAWGRLHRALGPLRLSGASGRLGALIRQSVGAFGYDIRGTLTSDGISKPTVFGRAFVAWRDVTHVSETPFRITLHTTGKRLNLNPRVIGGEELARELGRFVPHL